MVVALCSGGVVGCGGDEGNEGGAAGTTDGATGTTDGGTGATDGTATGTEEPECLTPAHCVGVVDPGQCERAACEDGKCTVAPQPEGAPCVPDDSLVGPCVAGGACAAVECTLVEKDCNDGDPCTTDSCDAATGDCVNAADVPECESECSTDADCAPTGDPCTANLCVDGKCGESTATDGAPCAPGTEAPCIVAGVCADGACEDVPKNCDDGLECTEDSCDAETGECVNVEGPDGCGAEAECSEDADCAEKLGPLVCKVPVCDETNTCVAAEAEEGAGCEDPSFADNSCIVGGSCAEGTCVGQEKNCDDQLDCTTDSCDSGTGQCVHTSESEDCGQECAETGDCPEGQYCDTKLFGDDLCKPKKIDGTSCGDAEECQSAECGGCFVNDWCYTPSSKAIGDACLVDAECGSGSCTASCNTPFPQTGVCECQVDEDCGPDAYCESSLLGDEQCVAKKADCASCDNNFECASDFCDEGFLGTGGKCATAGVLEVGDSCCKDSQCLSGNCENAECVGCTADEDCEEGQACTNNACKGKKPIGEACSDEAQCETGSCSGGQCVCVEDAQCGEGNWCDTSFLGQNQCEELLDECASCGAHNECASGVCEGLFSPFSNKCITEASLEVGEACCKDAQCISGQCDDDDNDAVVCQCTDDSHCPQGQTCNTSLFGANTCE